MRMLLVEDEPVLARHLLRGLREAGYAADLAPTYATAVDLAIENEYDVVVLDLMLPDGSGIDLLRDWRSEGLAMPVLVLTARDGVEDKVRGLDAGGDDYLTKPFEFAELLARLRSLLRRPATAPVETLVCVDLMLDRTRHRVERGGRTIQLTHKEFALLEYFMLHPQRVLRRIDLGEHVWDHRYEAQSNVIDVMVGRLRRKLEADGEPRLIHTVKGLGYVLRAPEGAEP